MDHLLLWAAGQTFQATVLGLGSHLFAAQPVCPAPDLGPVLLALKEVSRGAGSAECGRINLDLVPGLALGGALLVAGFIAGLCSGLLLWCLLPALSSWRRPPVILEAPVARQSGPTTVAGPVTPKVWQQRALED